MDRLDAAKMVNLVFSAKTEKQPIHREMLPIKTRRLIKLFIDGAIFQSLEKKIELFSNPWKFALYGVGPQFTLVHEERI